MGTAGVGVYKQKTGVNLELKKIQAASNKVTVVDNTGASQVDIDVVPGNFAAASISQSAISGLAAALALLATLAGPTSAGTNTTQLATTAFVQSASKPYDISVLAFGEATTRTTGTGDFSLGIRCPRAFLLTEIYFRCKTADASGNLVVEIQKNGVQVASTPTTISAANQVAGGGQTGLSASFAAGDILTINITTVGTTPGVGLTCDMKATAV